MTGSSPRIYRRPLAHTEHPDEYCIGGLAPVYLGDVLASRYKIFRKLGHGSQSTVWLARDLICSSYVAVKVHTAADFHALEPSHHANISSLLNRFILDSPNGKHECIVLEPLGRTLRAVIDQSLEIKFGSDDSGEYYARYNPHHWTIALARDFCRQVITALDSLHSQGTAHRDVQPGNIAMALSYDINSRSMDEIQQKGAWYSDLVPSDDTDDWDAKNLKALGEDIAWVQRLDEKPLDPTEIQYTVRASPLHDQIIFDDSQPFRAVLFDFGFSRRFEDCDHPLTQVDNYRPPEAILPTPVTWKADIFSAGLVLWEIVMTRNFVWTTYLRDGLDDTQYLKDLAQRIGSLPACFREAYVFEDIEEEELDEEDLAYGDMRFAARRDGPRDMRDKELEDFVDLMSGMLRWEPGERPTTRTILDHAFFRSVHQ